MKLTLVFLYFRRLQLRPIGDESMESMNSMNSLSLNDDGKMQDDNDNDGESKSNRK